jgi:hypothetical protein
MAQEGISTLPQSPENQTPSMEKIPFSQELENTKAALSQANPEYVPAYEQGMEQVIQQLNLPVEELNVLKQILEYLLQNEAEYPQLRQRLINEAGVRPEDIPEEFDRGYLTTMLVVVQEAISRNQGQTPAMGSSMPEPQGFRRGGLAAAAEALRKKGRGGDTILAHINPQEAKLLKAMGGSGTINPATGIMEFKGGGGGILGGVGKAIGGAFSAVGNAVKSVASSTVGKIVMTVALGVALGPAGLALMPSWAAGALAAGAVSMAAGNSLSDSLKAAAIGGVAGYFAPGLSDSIGTLGQTGALGQFINQGLTGAAIGTGYGLLTGQTPGQALKTGAIAGLTAGAIGSIMPGPRTDGGALVTDNSQILNADGTRAPLSGGAVLPSSQGISTLPSGQTNLQAPIPEYDFTGLSAEARTPTIDIGFGPDRFSPPVSSAAAPTAPTGPDTSFSQGMREFGGAPTQAPVQKGPLTDTSLSQGMREFGGGANQPSSNTGIGGYLNKASDYLFSKDPSNPGFFYNSKGEISIPAVTGTVLAGGALMGGFTPTPVAPPGMVNRNVTGESLISQNPNQYIVGGLPGYNAPTPAPMSANYVASPSYGSNRSVYYPTYTPPPNTATFSPNQAIQQPYNTPLNYNFLPRYASGGISQFPRRVGKIDGPGTGTSDSIPAMLSDGEFVLTAKAVRGAGNGSRRAGAKKLYRMMHALEKKAGGTV